MVSKNNHLKDCHIKVHGSDIAFLHEINFPISHTARIALAEKVAELRLKFPQQTLNENESVMQSA